MLKTVVQLSRINGCEVLWIDAVIIAERPKLASYVEAMKRAISESGISSGSINIKAKTNEGMGFIGRGEGIAAQAVCLLKRIV
jgi:2-C-methyl-D-erythritol 2,4-cyclodiphosphate synthase